MGAVDVAGFSTSTKSRGRRAPLPRNASLHHPTSDARRRGCRAGRAVRAPGARRQGRHGMEAQTRRSSMAPHTPASPDFQAQDFQAQDFQAEDETPARGRLAQLWQVPLLLLSLGLFGYAAYLFIDPKPGLTIEQKIDLAAAHLKHERPEAAVEYTRKLLASERLAKENEARLHLMLAEA